MFDFPSRERIAEVGEPKSAQGVKKGEPIPEQGANRGKDDLISPSGKPKSASEDPPSLKSWEDLEISFLSDERVQIIRSGKPTETLNYAEMDFKDGRNGKPNQAWLTLRALAEEHGIIRDAKTTGSAWRKVEKRMQEIRKALRKHFDISSDPVPFVQGTGYQACFKIGCGPSFRT